MPWLKLSGQYPKALKLTRQQEAILKPIGPILRTDEVPVLFTKAEIRSQNTLPKLGLYGLYNQMERLMFIDADSIVVKNVDHLLETLRQVFAEIG